MYFFTCNLTCVYSQIIVYSFHTPGKADTSSYKKSKEPQMERRWSAGGARAAAGGGRAAAGAAEHSRRRSQDSGARAAARAGRGRGGP